jgi:hypothetical protein
MEGVEVSEDTLTGWIWCENIGWVSLHCENTASCETVEYGVEQEGGGPLSGFAFSENAGWINFNPETAGVSIDPDTGEFGGYAWGENIGWVSFSCEDSSTCGNVDYGVKTDWTCPESSSTQTTSSLYLSWLWPDTELSWTPLPDATWYDVIMGDLVDLRATGGDFSSATQLCLDNNNMDLTALHSDLPPPHGGYWFLVRGCNCAGPGSFDTGEAGQWAPRDTGIVNSTLACP